MDETFMFVRTCFRMNITIFESILLELLYIRENLPLSNHERKKLVL